MYRQQQRRTAPSNDVEYDAPHAPSQLPVNVKIIQGDILEASEDVIGHQCNCVTKKAKGLADVLFQRFPYADLYADRRDGVVRRHEPGVCVLLGAPGKPLIANMFAQRRGGRPKAKDDTASMRMRWFDECLKQIIEQAPHVKSIALPYNIGCGLAGGDWSRYLGMICRFASRHPNVRITLYQLPDSAVMMELPHEA